MNKILLIFLMFGFVCNAQLMGVVNSQQSMSVTAPPEPEPLTTRFIIAGASIAYNVFFFTESMKSTIESTYPGSTVFIYNHASPGETIGSYATGSVPNITNTLSLYGSDNTYTKTYVIIDLGGNDRTNRGTWDSLTESEITSMSTNLNVILDAIEAKGFTPILNDQTFRIYDSNVDEDYGILPYNENLIQPKILSRTSEFAFEDGQSFWQMYSLIYNNYETYLSSDNIHPSGTGYAALRTAFVNTICKYIFTGIPPTKIIKNGSIPAPPPLDNMYDEDEYLNAHFYPLEGATLEGLQNAIDTYGSVRLEAGEYGTSAQMLYLDSNKKLYGVPFATKTPRITIESGSSGIVIDGVNASGRIFFEAGSSITNNVIKNTYSTQLNATNASISNNKFISVTGQIIWDMSTSGYFRNNTFIRHWIHASSPQIVLKGNTTTPSYGNLHLWVNILTPGGEGNDFDTLEDVTIIGLDAEGWNLSSGTDKAMTVMNNIGDVKITDFGGGNGYSPVKTPPFDIQSDNLYLLNANLNNADTENNSKADANIFILNGRSNYDLEAGGFEVDLKRANTATYNGVSLNSTITDTTTITNIKSFILGTEKTPISRPNLDVIPNPAGEDWATERLGKTDQAAYIQELINNNKIAELSEGIYYIGSTLTLKGQNEGIRGAGTGKTVIVGLTDDFPLITFSDINTNRRWHISNLTLQGGHTGLRVQTSSDAQMMVTGVAMHDVVFRNQTYGMHLYRFFGLDNNFFENVNFISCDIGLYQERNPDSNTTQDDIMYMDKNVFYKTQVINCGIGFSMIAGRPNNLNTWVDCVFDGNGLAADLHYNNYASFVNCDFKNHSGENVIGRGSPLSLYSCNFSSNTTTSIFKTTSLTMEGCTLSDNVPLLVNVAFNPVNAYIQNSIVTGTLGTLGTYGNGIIANSSMLGNPELNKLLVKIVSGTATTLIDEVPDPYPQLLVTHE